MFEKKKALSIIYWLISGIFLFLFIYLLIKLFPAYGVFFSFLWKIFAPFLIAALIAYLLHPFVKKMHTFHIHKAVSILLIYFVFFGGVGYAIFRLHPAIVHQLRDLSDQLPHLMSMYSDAVYKMYEYTSFLPETVHDKMDGLFDRLESKMDSFIGDIVGMLTKVVDMIVLVTVIPVLVFYFLKDFTTIKRYVKKWIPRNYQQEASRLVHAIDDSLGSYLRGLLIVNLFVGIAAFIVLHFLHVKYALLLAIIMGITNIIPYFGPIIGAIPALLITIPVSVKLAIIVMVAFFIIQLIESNLLSPYIYGKSIHIHPIVIIFALLVGGEIGGVIGMVLAVPVLTICHVAFTHFLQIRRNH